jgi:deoxyhypusine synthase
MSHRIEAEIIPYSFKELELSDAQRRRKTEILSSPVIPFKPQLGMTALEFFQKNSLTGNRMAHLPSEVDRFLDKHGKLPVLEFFHKEEKEGSLFKDFYQAAKLWDQMLSEKRTVYCAAAGAFIPFGGREAFRSLIENDQIDVLVVTGAQLTHDFVETLGGKHYLMLSGRISDVELASLNINRFYQVLGDGEDYKKIDHILLDLIPQLPPRRLMTSREYLWRLGHALIPYAKEEGILTTAARKNLPIYLPAMGDAAVGTDVLEVWHKVGRRISLDIVLSDELEKMEIAAAVEDFGARTSLVIFGGGVVRNNAQQAQASTYAIGRKTKGHLEGIRFWTGDLTDGGLSSSTISEGITWGKFDPEVSKVEVFADSNFAINVMAQLLLDLRNGKKREWKPKFLFRADGSLTVGFPNREKRNLQAQFKRDIGKPVY